MKKHFLLLALLLVLLCRVSSAEENVYGKTRMTVRVREEASVSSAIVDNITSSACVYILSTEEDDDYTFGEVNYRDYYGNIVTGWVCLSHGDSEYVRIMEDDEAQSFFRVADGNLPKACVGTFKTGNSAAGNSGSVSSPAGNSGTSSSGSTSSSAITAVEIKQLQQNLTTLGLYSGSITGNVGTRTAAAIKSFQKKVGLTATGKPDWATIEAAQDAVDGDSAVSTGSTSSEIASNSTSSSSASGTITAAEIKQLQQNLTTLGLYSGSITGNVGTRTAAAIKSFQKKVGLTATGKPDRATIEAVQDALNGNHTSAPESSGISSGSGTVYNVEWFANKVNFYNKAGLKMGAQATLTDLTTGKSLQIYVQSTGNHADVEPLTAADTATLCSLYGVSSAKSITYVRRPMLVDTGSARMVCSIYGVPHGEQRIKDNNFPGQFCLHFLGSKTHGSAKVDPDHQATILKAVNIMKGKGFSVSTKAP